MRKLFVLAVSLLTGIQFTIAQNNFPAGSVDMPVSDCNGACQKDDLVLKTESSSSRLEQNEPNPFSENTVICYYIPESVVNACIRIYSLQGYELMSMLISGRGAGDTTIAARIFAPGVYNYSLIINDSVADTKTLVLTK